MKRNSLKYSGIGSILSSMPAGGGGVKPQEWPMEWPQPGPVRGSYYIPRLGGALKLLVDPMRQMKLHSVANNEILGANIVTNGDFHDFTFDATSRAQKNVSTVFIDSVEYVVGSETSPYSNANVEDGVCWEVEEVSGSPGIDVRMTFIIPSGEVPDYVTIKAYYSGTDRRDVYLEVWNETTSDWDYVTTVTLDEELDVYTVDLDPNHVFNDTLTMRFYHPDNGNPSYYLCVDYLAVTTEIQGVVAYWVFDDIYHAQEGTGKTVIQDLSGNEHDLSIGGWTDYNDLLTDMTGVSPIYQGGHGLKFPGVNEHLYIPAAQATDFNPGRGDFTIEGWINVGTFADAQIIIAKQYLNGWAYYLYEEVGGYLKIGFYDGTNYYALTSTSTINDGNPHYFAVCRSEQVVSLWIDGVKDIENITLLPSGADIDADGDLVIGKQYLGIPYFANQITTIRYSSKALTEQEIKESYGLAKGWSSGTYSIESKSVVYVNSEFSQKIIGQTDNKTDDAFVIQELPVQDGVLYKISATVVDKDITTERIDVKMAKHNGSPHPDMLVSLYQSDTTPFTYVGYFYGNTTYPYIWLATSNWADTGHYVIFDNVSIRPVLNAVKPANFVEDFSKGGARYVEITAENQGTQSTSQIYANSTKTNYYWGDGSSAEVIGDFRVTNGNHGIMMNNLEDDQPAHPAAFKFNGIDQYVNFGDTLDLKNYDWLFADWVKDDNLASKYFISKYEDANNHWYIGTDANGNIVAKAVDSGTTIWDYVSQTALINDAWNFVAVARIGSDIKMCINGTEVSVTANTAVQPGSVENAGNLYKMRFNTTYSDGYDGISPIYIFDGQDGALAKAPERIERLIEYIYYQTKYWLKK